MKGGGGGAAREACSSNLEYGKPSQHLLTDTGKPSKTCVEMAGLRTFRILTYSQLHNYRFIHLNLPTRRFNLLNPTGYVMHQQFNIQQLYVLSTLYLCVLYLSENKQRLVPLTA